MDEKKNGSEFIKENSVIASEKDDSLSGRRFSTSQSSSKSYSDDDFWDIGMPRRKVYTAPTYSDDQRTPKDIEEKNPPVSSVKRETIPPRTEGSSLPMQGRKADNTQSQPDFSNFRTSNYRAQRQSGYQSNTDGMFGGRNEAKISVITDEYSPERILIKSVKVSPWQTNTQFYQRFISDAAQFHVKTPVECQLVPFFAYVPQYSKMNDKQQMCYLVIRECIRQNRCIDFTKIIDTQRIADYISYVLLYIYEIINLPDIIKPEEGIKLLSRIWLFYRRQTPHIDEYLSEWMIDYCLIHHLDLPDELNPILPEIIQKTQFREFYFDMMKQSEDSMAVAANILIDQFSDYDYKKSRYYQDNNAEYNKWIPSAVTEVLKDQSVKQRGIFDFGKKYRMTRDAYCGAVAPAVTKRKISVEFLSFTRQIETRTFLTSLVKYSENKLRLGLRIKAKLNHDALEKSDSDIIDSFFAPMLTEASLTTGMGRNKKAEEETYLKAYDAESTGFSFEDAHRIEGLSWQNTVMLTKETEDRIDTSDVKPNNPMPESQVQKEPLQVQTEPLFENEEMPEIEGQIDYSDDSQNETVPDVHNDCEDENANDTEADENENEYSSEREALKIIMNSPRQYKSWCRENGVFPDDMVSRINDIFNDILGDIAVEENGGVYGIIEDYREDIVKWLN